MVSALARKNGVRASRIWRRLLGVEKVAVERVEFDEDRNAVIAHLRTRKSASGRCSRCGTACPGYDKGVGRRRWRALDLGTVQVHLEADLPRVRCPEHHVVVSAVPWARPGSGFTRDFEQTCVWLVKHLAKTHVAELLRVAFRTVDDITTRVVADLTGTLDRFKGLTRIGIDEIAYRKGHRYLTVVVDHDTGRIVWAAQGRNKETLNRFFDDLGPDRTRKITVVSADAAEWISTVVEARCPRAKRCMDPFHVVAWATAAVDTIRRKTVSALRGQGDAAAARDLKGTRWALLKNPENQTGDQRTTVAAIARTNKPLYRAYLLKEQLRAVFAVGGDKGRKLLAGWLAWAKRSRLPEFVALAATIDKQRTAILNTLEHVVSNARVEATNTHLRQLTRRAYGYHTPDALIAMATLTRGGLKIDLPGRAP